METKILTYEQMQEASEDLKSGKVICFPTETVYGIGVIANSEKAYNDLVLAKRRPPMKPFSLMCSSLEEAFCFAELTSNAKAVMNKFMPGEITVLVKAKEGLYPWITLGTPVIGIRVPDSKFVLGLIKSVGYPCLVTSANHSGEKTSATFEETLKSFNGEVSAIVKGECTSKLASTIVDLSDSEQIKLIREGPIPFDRIKSVWEASK